MSYWARFLITVKTSIFREQKELQLLRNGREHKCRCCRNSLLVLQSCLWDHLEEDGKQKGNRVVLEAVCWLKTTQAEPGQLHHTPWKLKEAVPAQSPAPAFANTDTEFSNNSECHPFLLSVPSQISLQTLIKELDCRISGGFLRQVLDTGISCVFVQENNFQVLFQNLVEMPTGKSSQRYLVPGCFLQIDAWVMRLVRLLILSPWEKLQLENFSPFLHIEIPTGAKLRTSTCRKSFDQCLHIIRTQKTLLLGTNPQKINQNPFVYGYRNN